MRRRTLKARFGSRSLRSEISELLLATAHGAQAEMSCNSPESSGRAEAKVVWRLLKEPITYHLSGFFKEGCEKIDLKPGKMELGCFFVCMFWVYSRLFPECVAKGSRLTLGV